MGGKRKIGVGLLIFGLLFAGIGAVTAASINIDRVYVGWNESRVGFVDYQGTDENNTIGWLVVKVDDVVILKTEVEARVLQIANRTFNLYGFEYFKIDEAEGMHTIRASISCEGGSSVVCTSYYGLGIPDVDMGEKGEERKR